MTETRWGAMPQGIAKAVIAIKKQVKQLGSDEKNEHGGYRYVSVDKFYERIGPMMAEAGLALLIDETETDVRVSETTDRNGNLRKTPWLFAQYSLAFMHEAGETSAPMRRSLAMPITGPQSYGAAQSYVEKQFLRQIFKIPTGEKDADETAQDQDAPPRTRPHTTAATRTATAPPPPERPTHLNGVNGASLPPNSEESGEVTAARQRVKMLIGKLDQHIKTAPNDHALDVAWDDARTELAEIEAVTEPVIKNNATGKLMTGLEVGEDLRARYSRRIAELRGGAAA